MPKDEIFSNNLIDLITKMLLLDSSKRISMEEIKAHPWMNENVPTK